MEKGLSLAASLWRNLISLSLFKQLGASKKAFLIQTNNHFCNNQSSSYLLDTSCGFLGTARLSSSFQIEPIHSTFEDNFLRLSAVNVDLLSIFLDDGDWNYIVMREYYKIKSTTKIGIAQKEIFIIKHPNLTRFFPKKNYLSVTQ